MSTSSLSEFDINPAFGLTQTADMRARAGNFYLEVAGVPGGCKIKGQEGKTALYGIAYTIVSPRDAATGLATGKRIHGPLDVVGKVDKSSPLLFKKLAENADLASVKVHCWSAVTLAEGASSGGSKEIYKIELINAVVTAFRHFVHHDGTLCFIASFTYKAITLTWVDGGIEGSDDWLSAT